MDQLGIAAGFSLSAMDPLLIALRKFSPDVIAVESISGEECTSMRLAPDIFNSNDIKRFCYDNTAALHALGLDYQRAKARLQVLMHDWTGFKAATQRRELIVHFLAVGEPVSAVAQWLQLPPKERQADGVLTKELMGWLEKASVSPDERYQVGARLAAALGLVMVHSIDDHTGDSSAIARSDEYADAVRRAWEQDRPRIDSLLGKQKALAQQREFVSLYRYVNNDLVQHELVDADMGAVLRNKSAAGFGAVYIAGWEARNLRMAGNIRASFVDKPDARVLVVVGASHKSWLDMFMRSGLLINIENVEEILR